MTEKQFANLTVQLWRAIQRAERLTKAFAKTIGTDACLTQIHNGSVDRVLAACERRDKAMRKLQQAVAQSHLKIKVRA